MPFGQHFLVPNQTRSNQMLFRFILRRRHTLFSFYFIQILQSQERTTNHRMDERTISTFLLKVNIAIIQNEH